MTWACTIIIRVMAWRSRYLYDLGEWHDMLDVEDGTMMMKMTHICIYSVLFGCNAYFITNCQALSFSRTKFMKVSGNKVKQICIKDSISHHLFSVIRHRNKRLLINCSVMLSHHSSDGFFLDEPSPHNDIA